MSDTASKQQVYKFRPIRKNNRSNNFLKIWHFWIYSEEELVEIYRDSQTNSISVFFVSKTFSRSNQDLLLPNQLFGVEV